MTDLDPFDARVSGLLSAIDPAARRKLARIIATRLRASTATRIGQQLNPDGTAFEPRKPVQRLRNQRGGIRRRAMFAKLRTSKWLKAEATAEAAVVTFAAGVQRIARVHQFGLRDRVNRSGLEVTYPARRLLGLTAADIDTIENEVLNHLTNHARRE